MGTLIYNDVREINHRGYVFMQSEELDTFSVDVNSTVSLRGLAMGVLEGVQRRVDRPLIGVFGGEGIGPELWDCARRVLTVVERMGGVNAEIELGGAIGLEARDVSGGELTGDVIEFCGDVFGRGGAVLAGPGGGRFVYDMRSEFELYVKFSPIVPAGALVDGGRLKGACVKGVDIQFVRDNIAGVYQGCETVGESEVGDEMVRHTFSYTAGQVRALVEAGAGLARGRRGGRVTVVVKKGGMPVMSSMWARVAKEVCGVAGVELEIMDVDYCAYRLIQEPGSFDVVIAPNLIGDILSDLGAVLLGSRGLSYAGSYSATGAAVYQTNHGSAHDLVGTGRANPGGHLYALAMMLRESFGWVAEADAIVGGMEDVWEDGWRTDDLGTGVDEQKVIGSEAFMDRVVEAVGRRVDESGEGS